MIQDTGTPYERFVLIVPKSEEGTRVDLFLPAALAATHDVVWSRRAVRRAIDGGAVWLDGRRLRVTSRRLRRGQRLEVRVLDEQTPPSSAVPKLEERQILFEDRWLIALDKAPGLPSQATPTDALFNALEAVRAFLRGRGDDATEVELAHRLDRGTSGVLLLVKNRKAMAPIAAAFAERRVAKSYRVLVSLEVPAECPESWTIDKPLARDGRLMQVDPLGKEAVTEIRLMKSWPSSALLEARPKTGRKHQIRAHLAAESRPVLGDRLYGRAYPGVSRPMLHAASLGFEHPMNGEDILIEAPLPTDFEEMAKGLGPGQTFANEQAAVRDVALEDGPAAPPFPAEDPESKG